MSTTRARLQELGLDDLRSMAGLVEVDPDGLQKSPCFDPGHDWEMASRAFTGGRTLVARQCAVCDLSVVEVLA